MRRLKKRLGGRGGFTLVEMAAAAAVLSLLALILHTGLLMAQDSYNKMVGEAESQLLLSTLTDLLSNELRYARNVETDDADRLLNYTSANYGRHTSLSLDDQGQLAANGRPMLSTGAYGNGDYAIEDWSVVYDGETFQVTLVVEGRYGSAKTGSFSVRCLNWDAGEGGST